MKQDKRFEDVLYQCLNRILSGETVENCLRDYPEQARELEPLLRIAVAAKQASHIQPRAEFKSKARYEFTAALRDMQTRKTSRWYSSLFEPVFAWRTGWTVALIAVLVVVFGGGSTVVAASTSMPDSALYPVKLATEQAQLAVTPSNIGKAELNAKFADRRAEEIAYLANKGDAQEVQLAAQRLNTNLENMTNLAKVDSKNSKAGSNPSFSASAQANDASNASAARPQPAAGAVAPREGTPESVPVLSGPISAPMMAPVPNIPPSVSANATPATKVPAVKSPPNTEKSAPAATGSQVRPAVTPVPSPKVTVKSENAADNAARNNSANSRSSDNSKAADNAKLKQIITDNYKKTESRLNETLKKSSPDVRPAIRQALANSQTEFEKALKNLDQAADNE